MAIIKLVCQGCGANLDALDTSRIIACGYCGTQNQIKPTVYQEPAPPPPPSLPSVVQYQVGAPQRPAKSSSVVGVAVLLAVVAPLVVGGAIAFMGFRGFESMVTAERGRAGGRALSGDGPARQYGWQSERPFIGDLDGDGSEDLLGVIQIAGSSNPVLVAISGADWRTLWEIDLGDRSAMPSGPQLRFVDDHALALFAMGALIRAYDAGTGQTKWVAELPDQTAMIVRDGEQLWVRSLDESTHTIALASGSVTPTTDAPSPAARPLRSDEGYDLIPSNRLLELEYEQFADLRVETAFCPPELLELSADPIRGFDRVPCTWKHGLAWASRSKGTALPFLVAYDPATRQERWRTQLTPAGSLETIDQGFNQPRAEFVDDDAIVSFSPTNAEGAVTIRRLDMNSGASKWETKLDQTLTENLDGMVVGKDRLYADYGACMVVIDLASGNVIERLGGW